MTRLHCIVVALCLAALLAGCAANTVARRSASAEFRPQARIVILPYENLSGQEQVGSKITEYFQALLATESKFRVVEAGPVLELLRRQRIRSSSFLTTNQIDSIAAGLQADYILTGSVLEYNEMTNTFLGTIPQISFDSRLIDCRSKATVWTSVSTGSGDKGELVFGIGAIRSSDQLARKMVGGVVSKITELF